MRAQSWQYGRLCSLVYELDKPIGTSFGDVEFYRDRLAGVTGEVLEPAVGTGRILIPLLESGLRVRGYDTSAHMLARCRDNCTARGLDPVLFEADLVTHREPGAYDAIIIPTGSFALVLGPEPVAAALRNIRASLTPGGRFIVDVEPLDPTTPPGPMGHWWHGEELVTLTPIANPNPPEGTTSGWGRYELWREGRLVTAELEPFTLQIHNLDGFTALLTEAGFTDITIHADYQPDQPPGPTTQIWTFEAG